jgi:cytidylate kinase
MHVLVTGASGSGTTTLGRALATRIGAQLVDADDLYWLPSDPAFTSKRDRAERAELLREKLTAGPTVVAGSIMGWDGDLENAFGLIVFLRAPAEVRVPRLIARDRERFGRVNEEFVAWAAQYDGGTLEGRNLARHLAWLEQRRCPVLRTSRGS